MIDKRLVFKNVLLWFVIVIERDKYISMMSFFFEMNLKGIIVFSVFVWCW